MKAKVVVAAPCEAAGYRFTAVPPLESCTHAVVLGKPGGGSRTAESAKHQSCRTEHHDWELVMEYDGEKLVVGRCRTCRSESWASARPVMVREVDIARGALA